MGVRITPCYRCPLRDGCQQREIYRQKASGTGAVSIRFKCKILADRLIPGVRVKIPHPVGMTGYDPYGGEHTFFRSFPLPATILSSDGYNFSAVIDKDQTDEEGEPLKNRFRRKMPAYRIVEFLDEPPRKICEQGNMLLEDGTCDTSSGCGCKAWYNLAEVMRNDQA